MVELPRRICISLPKDQIEKIESLRSTTSRSKFISTLIDKSLDQEDQQKESNKDDS